jgi:hypothetical protein
MGYCQKEPILFTPSRHLTFQEYFAAKEVVNDKEQTTLFGLLEPNTVARIVGAKSS